MKEIPFDLQNADKILKDNFDAYYDSDDFKELIGVKPMSHKEQKQMLIDAIKKERDWLDTIESDKFLLTYEKNMVSNVTTVVLN